MSTGYADRVGETVAQRDRVQALMDGTAIDTVDATEFKVGGLVTDFKQLTAGTGITTGTGTIYESSVTKVGGIIKTEILIDLTGLNSGGTAGDIIGKDGGTANCHIGQITAAVNGTIIGGKVECFETPDGGDPDINIHAGDEATGAQDAGVSGLTNSALLVNAGDHSLGTSDYFTAFPAANQYLYLACGDATDADYTAGRLLITLWGV